MREERPRLILKYFLPRWARENDIKISEGSSCFFARTGLRDSFGVILRDMPTTTQRKLFLLAGVANYRFFFFAKITFQLSL